MRYFWVMLVISVAVFITVLCLEDRAATHEERGLHLFIGLLSLLFAIASASLLCLIAGFESFRRKHANDQALTAE